MNGSIMQAIQRSRSPSMPTHWQSRGTRNANAARFGPIVLFTGVIVMTCIAFAASSWSSTSHKFPVPAGSIRIVGSSSGEHTVLRDDGLVSHVLYSKNEQRDFLVKYAFTCHSQQLLNRYDDLSHRYQEELFKYCILYVGHGNLWLDDGELLVDASELHGIKKSIGVELERGNMLHSSFLKVQRRKDPILREMMRMLLETSNDVLYSSDLLLEQNMFKRAQSVKDNWVFWKLNCVDLANTSNPQSSDTINVAQRNLQFKRNSDASLAQQGITPFGETFGVQRSCPIKGGFCCQVLDSKQEIVMALQHPIRGEDEVDDLAFISSVTRKPLDNVKDNTSQMTPNFFDILLQNDCLPTQKQCHKCLKKSGSCDLCMEECPCYCHALCRFRPPPKVVVEEWRIKVPKYRKDPSRLVPKIIHQTWYEAITKKEYPNMSRLIESFKQSGWEYQFYDDERGVEFLKEHFPPQVLDAYESILPGAFKADLFRYCVLLIKGGVYADMDVLLVSNLDELLTADVGFLVPIDEPGSSIGRRSCLWNGFLAVAPGHPFLAKTIELVVNNARNRFTSVDIDDMLCPTPELGVSHSVDTLFVCGPCILGAAMNTVLGRHMQTEWEIGDVNVWSKEDGNEIAVPSDDPRLKIPGRTIILNQNKKDMGAHRFTWLERNLIVAATDLPDYDDRPADIEHYSKTHEKVGVFGLKKLYKDSFKANEAIRIIVE